MTIKGENNVVYDCYQSEGKILVDTKDRKAFIMRKEYNILLTYSTIIKAICNTTHQNPKKSCFGGFGFEVL